MLKQNDLIKQDDLGSIEQKRAFLKLPLAERRRILLQQAEDAAEHYEDTRVQASAKLGRAAILSTIGRPKHLRVNMLARLGSRM